MSKNAKIIIAAGFTVLVSLICVLFAKIGALESQNGGSSSPVAAYQPQQTNTNTKEPANNTAAVPGDQITLALDTTSSWGDVGNMSTQLSAKITNNAQTSATDWKIMIPVSEDVEVINIWNGNQVKENNTLIITAGDWNKEIGAGQTLEIGFQLSSDSALDLNKYSAQATIDNKAVSFVYPDSSAPVESPVETPVPVPVPVPAAAAGDNGVSAHGQLKVTGTSLTDKNGDPVVLKGMSSHGLVWFPQFVNKYTINKTKEYGANVYRAAMYTEEYGGYTTDANSQKTSKDLAYTGIDTAISLDMYAILDWHILSDGSPSKHITEAKAFFDEASKRYANNPAVIYEICNEPNGSDWSSDIKPYANEIIPIIRKNSPNAIILVGSNTWSQDVDIASKDKLEFDNIMYTFHFYAGTHRLDNFKPKIETALANGCAVFVSEWGTTDASGNGNVDTAESTKWLEYLKSKNISRISWSLADKSESSAAFMPGTDAESFTYDNLTQSGKFVFDSFSKY